MTQEALKLALDALIWTTGSGDFGEGGQAHEGAKKCLFPAITAIKEALAQEQEPVKIAHRHEWFRTGEMKVGQMRCIGCGKWGQEEAPQRTWVGLTDEDCKGMSAGDRMVAMWADRTLKGKNNV